MPPLEYLNYFLFQFRMHPWTCFQKWIDVCRKRCVHSSSLHGITEGNWFGLLCSIGFYLQLYRIRIWACIDVFWFDKFVKLRIIKLFNNDIILNFMFTCLNNQKENDHQLIWYQLMFVWVKMEWSRM